jgi:tetratricopeptide (TPR) repeat protein
LGERLVAEADVADEEVVQSIKDGYAGLGEVYAMLGMPDEGAAMYAIAHDAFLRAGHYVIASLTSWRELASVVLPYRSEDIAERQRLAERMEREHEWASGAIPAAVPSRFLHLPLLVLEGEWEEAERLALVASTEGRGNIVFRTMALRYLAALARQRGDIARAWWVVRERLPLGTATEPGTVAHVGGVLAAQQVAVALALDAGDLAAAGGWLEAHDRWLAWSGAVLGLSEGRALWTQYHRQAGDPEQARTNARRALIYATEPRQPLALMAAHRLLGDLDTDAGRYDDAEHHLHTSLVLADACKAPYERALILLAMAKLQAATDDKGAALISLDEIRAICEPLGAKPALTRMKALAVQLT